MAPSSKKPPAERTPIADEVLAAINAHVAGGGTVYGLAKETKLAPSVIRRFRDGSRDLTLASVEALGRILNLRLVQVTAKPKRGRA